MLLAVITANEVSTIFNEHICMTIAMKLISTFA